MKTTPPIKHRRLSAKHLKTVVFIILSAILVIWFSRNLSWTEVQASLARANWKLLTAAVVAISLTYLLRALRWRALLSPITQTDMRAAFAATVIGFSAVFYYLVKGEINLTRLRKLPTAEANEVSLALPRSQAN